jgi:hypothetical protein
MHTEEEEEEEEEYSSNSNGSLVVGTVYESSPIANQNNQREG